MKISGRDFMDWFDGWNADEEFYWEDFAWMEQKEDILHDDDGNWKLDPDTVYDLHLLGEIRSQRVHGIEVNTEKTLKLWLERRGKELFLVRVPKEAATAFGKDIRPLGGTVLRTRPEKGKVLAADFVDWYDLAFPRNHYWEDHGDPIQTDDGVWTLDLDASVEPDELGVVVPEKRTVSGEGIAPSGLIKMHLKERSEAALVVLADPASIDVIRQIALDLGSSSSPSP